MQNSIDTILGFANDGFLPHGHCFLWRPDLLVASVASDGLIFVSYAVIAVGLWRFARNRRDLRSLHRSYMLFVFSGLFILFCGLTHFMDAWTVWYPDYWLSTGVKAVTAVASFGTALLLWPFIPRALALPSVQEMADLNAHLQFVREDEKRTIAKRLHDELITGLTVASMDLHNVQRQLAAEGNPLAPNVEMVIRLLEGSIDVKRNMVESLRPPMLHELGIAAALRQLAERFSAQTGIAHTLDIDPGAAGKVPEDLGMVLYRVAQECLDNVARHAQATRIELKLWGRGDEIELDVRDDGEGITIPKLEKRAGYGLRGSRQMLSRWRGTLTAQTAPGGGTLMRATARVDE